MTTDNIKELSEKLAKLYGVDAWTKLITGCNYGGGVNYEQLYLAEDSGRISDLADDYHINIIFSSFSKAITANVGGNNYVIERYSSFETKHDAARMARVRCLLAIKGVE